MNQSLRVAILIYCSSICATLFSCEGVLESLTAQNQNDYERISQYLIFDGTPIHYDVEKMGQFTVIPIGQRQLMTELRKAGGDGHHAQIVHHNAHGAQAIRILGIEIVKCENLRQSIEI